MQDSRAVSKTASDVQAPYHAGDFGEVILLTLATVLSVLWAIVLVTHFHATLSHVGQPLWLMQ